MPSGWDVYYLVCLSAVLALAIPGVLAVVSLLVKAKAPSATEERVSAPEALRARMGEADTVLGRRMNTRFFRGANATLALVVLALILIPCSGSLGAKPEADTLARCLALIVTIAGFTGLGLFYAARKGDLDWLRSFRDENTNGKEEP